MSLRRLHSIPVDRPVEAIVIGASAGGVDALSTLLPSLPARLAAAVFIVIHLPRERPSLLVEIFRSKCALPIREAEDKEPVRRGTVYFAPPDYHLLVDVGPRIALSADAFVNYSRPSIDVLFESAADVYRDRLLGIVLTGGNHDGAAGLAAIGRAGGAVVVQNPRSAQASFMPEAALRASPAAEVLDLAEISALLAILPSDATSDPFSTGH